MKEENSLDDSGGAVTKRRVTTTTLSTIVRTVGEGDGIRALGSSLEREALLTAVPKCFCALLDSKSIQIKDSL